jgi:hypothetical protein
LWLRRANEYCDRQHLILWLRRANEYCDRHGVHYCDNDLTVCASCEKHGMLYCDSQMQETKVLKTFLDKLPSLLISRRFLIVVVGILVNYLRDQVGLTEDQAQAITALLVSWVIGDSLNTTK